MVKFTHEQKQKIASTFQKVNAPADNGYGSQRLFTPTTLVEKFRAMSPYDFEFFVKELYETAGYKTVRAPLYKSTRFGKRIPQADGGIDYICEKKGTLYYMQIKAYKGAKQVGVSVMREFNSSLQDIGRQPQDKAYVITTTTFTNEAKKYADSHNMRCIDYKLFQTLFDAVSEHSSKNHDRLISYIDKIDYSKNQKYTKNMKTCPVCGAPLVKRHKQNSYFRGCQNYATTGCRYTEKIVSKEKESAGVR